MTLPLDRAPRQATALGGSLLARAVSTRELFAELHEPRSRSRADRHHRSPRLVELSRLVARLFLSTCHSSRPRFARGSGRGGAQLVGEVPLAEKPEQVRGEKRASRVRGSVQKSRRSEMPRASRVATSRVAARWLNCWRRH